MLALNGVAERNHSDRRTLCSVYSSAKSARMICICSVAGNDRFFHEVGVHVATRTTPSPKLEEKEMGAFLKKAERLRQSTALNFWIRRKQDDSDHNVSIYSLGPPKMDNKEEDGCE